MVAKSGDRRELFRILDAVKDPEVPVLSVEELGVLRDATVAPDGAVEVAITPTYSGCPAMHTIEADIVAALHEAGYPDVRVQTVFTPAWTTDWISAEAREKLRAYGIAPPSPRTGGDDELIPLLRRRAPEVVPCPYCGSEETVLKSEFGSTACKSIRFCTSCQQPFEQFKAI
ncbi:MAG TPA: 1,2-phenylacetyl-CoA epoxidase subunit PaaD [Gemmatimonadaceae bacterium]|nr:1,2-phenylacetyl-CoA epoxidase subunit PaaD [Gemmatimonadaceae bacterium]